SRSITPDRHRKRVEPTEQSVRPLWEAAGHITPVGGQNVGDIHHTADHPGSSTGWHRKVGVNHVRLQALRKTTAIYRGGGDVSGHCEQPAAITATSQRRNTMQRQVVKFFLGRQFSLSSRQHNDLMTACRQPGTDLLAYGTSAATDGGIFVVHDQYAHL